MIIVPAVRNIAAFTASHRTMLKNTYLASCLILMPAVVGCDAASTDSKSSGQADKAEASAPTEVKSTNPTYTCNIIENQHQCYTVAPLPALLDGEKGGCVAGTWSEGDSCPAQDMVGTCKMPGSSDVRKYYKGVTAEESKEHCEIIGGSFSAA